MPEVSDSGELFLRRREAAGSGAPDDMNYPFSQGLTFVARRWRNLMNEVLGIATMRLRRALQASMASDADVQALLDEVVARRLDPASAASAVLERRAIDPADAARG